MHETHKSLPRPPSLGDIPHPNHEKYQLVKLPHERWQQIGHNLVLDPRIRKMMLRYAEYRLLYGARGRCNGMMGLSGPPGTGKSDTVRWLADASMRRLHTQGNGFVVNATRLFDAHLGQSPKLVDDFLAETAFSASRAPTIVILDDAETLFLSRQQSIDNRDPTDVAKATTALLQGLDRLRYNANVLLLATLNMAGVVDEAVVSRSDLVLSFALPNAEQRAAILKPLVKGRAGERVLDTLVAATEGMSGRQLVKIEMLAYVEGTADKPEDLTAEDFLSAVGLTPDRVVSSDEQTTPETKEEEEACQTSSDKRSQEAVTPRKSRSIFALGWFATQPNT